MMDFNGPLNTTIECAPGHAYRTISRLDRSYESALADPWELEYFSEGESVMMQLEKTYDEVSDFADGRDITVDQVILYSSSRESISV